MPRRSLPRIDELSVPPVVGERYLVPTIRYKWFGEVAAWPVIGPKHDDLEIINFAAPHYHVDGRFLTRAQARKAHRYYFRGVSLALASAPIHVNLGSDESLPALVWRTRVCFTASVAYPDEIARRAWLPRLESYYQADNLRAGSGGWVCPHRGAPLGSMLPDDDGCITCPLHGLRWHAETGSPAFGGAV